MEKRIKDLELKKGADPAEVARLQRQLTDSQNNEQRLAQDNQTLMGENINLKRELSQERARGGKKW